MPYLFTYRFHFRFRVHEDVVTLAALSHNQVEESSCNALGESLLLRLMKGL